MRKFIQSIILSILALVSVSSFAGTYDGSYYTDQKRLDMFNNYANSYYQSQIVNGTGTVESIQKYQDTRLLNGKKGYVGSLEVTRTDSFLKTTVGSDYAKKSLIHLFDYSVVSNYGTTKTGAVDCRPYTSADRTVCWGSDGNKNSGFNGLAEIKVKNPFSSKSIVAQILSEQNKYSSIYYNYFYITTTTIKSGKVYVGFSQSFNDMTVENGLIYDALQNSDGTWTTVAVTTPPIDLGPVVIGPTPAPVAPVVVAQDCSSPDYTNKKSSSICLVGQVIEGCKLTTDNYQAFINTVAGNVGMTSVDLKITCSTGVNYHLKPIHDMISIQGTQETLKLTGWKDSGRGDKLTPLSAKVMTGNGNEQSVPIYFTLEGKGPSGTYGNSLINKFVGTAVYPIEISY